MRRAAGAALVWAAGAGAGMAEPAGWPDLPDRAACEAVLTVVKENCAVEHVFRCPGGVQRNEVRQPGEPVYSVSHSLTPLTDWAFASPVEGVFILIPDMTPILGLESLSTRDFPKQSGTATMWVPIFLDPMVGRFDAQFAFMDRKLDVDGFKLIGLDQRVAVSFNQGRFAISSQDERFVVENLGVSFAGSSETEAFGYTESYLEDPVRLIRPGEAGFLADPDEAACVQIGRMTDPAPVFEGETDAAL
jgi:hypothetical protein